MTKQTKVKEKIKFRPLSSFFTTTHNPVEKQGHAQINQDPNIVQDAAPVQTDDPTEPSPDLLPVEEPTESFSVPLPEKQPIEPIPVSLPKNEPIELIPVTFSEEEPSESISIPSPDEDDPSNPFEIETSQQLITLPQTQPIHLVEFNNRRVIQTEADFLTHLQQQLRRPIQTTAIPGNNYYHRRRFHYNSCARVEIDDNGHVIELYLNRCFFSILDSTIDQLPYLKKIEFCYNNLKILPENIGNLPHLILLNLSRNKLVTVPDSIGNLQNLESLTLDNNQIRTFPESLCNLSKLKTLIANKNMLIRLPDDFEKLESLQELSLTDNKLTSLPDNLSKLAQLTSIDLKGNKINNLPDSIVLLPMLKKLSLKNNQLAILPQDINKLSTLTSIDVSGNQLKILPDNLCKLSLLESIDLRQNVLTFLPDNFCDLTSLTTVKIDSNPWIFPLPKTARGIINLFQKIKIYLPTVLEKIEKNIRLVDWELACIPKLLLYRDTIRNACDQAQNQTSEQILKVLDSIGNVKVNNFNLLL